MVDPSLEPSVSVVIPTRGTRLRILERTISVLAGDQHVREIVIVDDRRSPATRLYDHQLPGVEVIVGDGLGPNHARQRGVEKSSAAVVLLLDDDVIPAPGLAARHAESHRESAPHVVVGYMPVATDQTGERLPPTACLYSQDYERRVAAYEESPETILSNLWGGNLSLPRAEALRVGFTDTDFRGYRHEDQEFGLRCLRLGLTGEFDRTLVSVHHYDRSTRDFLRDAWAQGYERAILSARYPDAGWHKSSTRAARAHGASSCHSDRPAPVGYAARILALKAGRRMQLWRGTVAARRAGPTTEFAQ
jgi:GT2 family glycosyltransferase